MFPEYGLNSISATTSTLPEELSLGQKFHVSGVDYVVAYNKETTQILPGQLCVATLTAGSTPYSVTVSSVTESVDPSVVGVVVHATALAGKYFYMATYGYPIGLYGAKSVPTAEYAGPAADGGVVTTATTDIMIAVNIGDAADATCTTDAKSGRFFFYGRTTTYGGQVESK